MTTRIGVARQVILAVLVAALLSAGVVVAAARTASERTAGEARAAGLAGATALDDGAAPAAPTSTTPTSVAAPTTTRAATPTTSVTTPRPSTKAAPAPPTTKAPARTAGASAAQRPAYYGPPDPNAVTVPYQPGQSSWSGTSNGIGVKVRIEPALPKAGEPVRFVLEATAPTPTCCQLHVWFGDGFGWPTGLEMRECDSHALVKRAEVVHTYNAHGRMEIMFSAFANGCVGDGPTGGLYASFDVAPGASSAQGPTPPNVRFDTSVRPPDIANDISYVTVAGMVTDDDGFIKRLVLDWGDGTPAQVLPGDRGECRPSLSGWPLQSMALISSTSSFITHRYAAPGVYRVTLTAISTACDGSDEQRGVGALTWHVPG
jgi:hypothetical protein